jgi:hypothetical protein
MILRTIQIFSSRHLSWSLPHAREIWIAHGSSIGGFASMRPGLIDPGKISLRRGHRLKPTAGFNEARINRSGK